MGFLYLVQDESATDSIDTNPMGMIIYASGLQKECRSIQLQHCETNNALRGLTLLANGQAELFERFTIKGCAEA